MQPPCCVCQDTTTTTSSTACTCAKPCSDCFHIIDSDANPATSLQHLIDRWLLTNPSQTPPSFPANAGLAVIRSLPNGAVPQTPLSITETLRLPGSENELSLQLVGGISLSLDGTLETYVRGHTIRGKRCWYRIVKTAVTELHSVPHANCILALYEPTSDDGTLPFTLPTSNMPALTPSVLDINSDPRQDLPIPPEDDNHSSCSSEAIDDLPPDFYSSQCMEDISYHPLVPDVDTSAVEIQEEAMEYIAESSARCAAGVNVILCTLAELSAGKIESAWVKDFITCFTARLPTNIPAVDYLEAYLHVTHFPYIDLPNKHIPGCMPLSTYASTPSHAKTVSVERYLQEVVMDPESTRAYDDSWLSYAFSVLLNSARNTDKRAPVVRRGLDHALPANTQQEYASLYGEHVLSELLYDSQNAKKHVNELCAMIKKYNWPTYFHTQTPNMKFFPGLAQAYSEMQNRSLDVRLFLPYINRLWHRQTHVHVAYIHTTLTQ